MLVKTLAESLPQRAYTATQVLENEAEISLSQQIALVALMERAGHACFRFMHENYPHVSKIFVLCGKGNNGGDGFVIARLAQEMGIHATVYLTTDKDSLVAESKAAFDLLLNTNATIIFQSELQLTTRFLQENDFDLVVDALFGIGFKGKLPPHYIDIIHAVNAYQATVISVDIPSGVDATTGYVATTAMIADVTVTLIVCKQGLFTGMAAQYVGQLYLADLEIGPQFQQAVDSSVEIQGQNNIPEKPQRHASSHKGDIGLLLSVGGNKGMPGAIRLSSESALRSGAALVAVCCHQENYSIVLNGRPELMLAPDDSDQLIKSQFYQKAKVLLCGPGLGKNTWSVALFNQVMASKKNCVIDADALHLLAKNFQYKDDWVLTPHPGEAAALLQCTVADIEKDRFKAVRNISQQYGGICILKGAGSLISDGKTVWINTSGNSGMATGGMGDVLSGIISALIMQSLTPVDAARLAVFIHGRSADIIATKQGKIGLLASDLFPEIQLLIN
ncbi:NAD(P)H-hydrate dehydratase [Thalassotalea castellviae]|uniref:Bifunctional NAD(P)H-hydrate repair enzyme n=1 Tax=Thalassotalea castellviae TaxID=3075612 RepID=A0ABU3A3S5_9GAMM|nr:NAD(P)H-hydrate dehydratase [Thalassotalea sp. W431]MDT0603763.1 NAD(P)H-hydrate dehydratase [Thalassotalea sp. W431]